MRLSLHQQLNQPYGEAAQEHETRYSVSSVDGVRDLYVTVEHTAINAINIPRFIASMRICYLSKSSLNISISASSVSQR